MRFLLTVGLLSLLVSPASADWPFGAHHANQVSRFFGVGWSDGYHSCRYDVRHPGSNLPPSPHWLQQRWRDAQPLHHVADPAPLGAPAVGPFQDVERPSQGQQQSASPTHPTEPPSILEEVPEQDQASEQGGAAEATEAQADYERFLEAVGRNGSRPVR